jgi:hypothetical protein
MKKLKKSLLILMDDLPFNNEEFYIIWAEGAICNIGFKMK